MIGAGFQQTWLGKPSTPAMFPFDAESLALGIWPRVQDKHDEIESLLSLLQRCLEISQTAVYRRIAPRRFDRQISGQASRHGCSWLRHPLPHSTSCACGFARPETSMSLILSVERPGPNPSSSGCTMRSSIGCIRRSRVASRLPATRALSGLGRTVDRLGAAGGSFVRMTQAFSTTSDMARLKLNVLRNFPHSSARLMPSLALRADPQRATRCRGHRHQRPAWQEGHQRRRFVRQAGLYRLLSRPIAIGKPRHKAKVHGGVNSAIVPMRLWKSVQGRIGA